MKKTNYLLILLGLVAIILTILNYLRLSDTDEVLSNKRMGINETNETNYTIADLEGKNLWSILGKTKSEELDKLAFGNKNNFNYGVVFIVDTIFCYSCFKFHTEILSSFKEISIPVITFTTQKFDFIESHIPASFVRELDTSKKLYNLNLNTLLVDKSGKILFAHIADKNNYDSSTRFYTSLKEFLQRN